MSSMAFVSHGVTRIRPGTVSPLVAWWSPNRRRRRHPTNFSSLCENRDQNALQVLKDEITQINGGTPLNVQSPKQVSTAIFGQPQTATKLVLQQATQDEQLHPTQRRLAQLVLDYRSVLQQSKASKTKPPSDESVPVVSSPRQATRPAPTYEQSVESLFRQRGSQLDEYWREPLQHLSRSTARSLTQQLDSEHCPMGYNPGASPTELGTTAVPAKKGTFLSYCREQKKLYPQCVVLVRCGDFYETFGLDAILLVEHVGLNPMAGKARAGCPYRNIQATVDGLTQQGFSVAVYEEVGTAQANSKLKTRVLTQIVSPASPTYLYDNWLLGSDHTSLDGLPPSRPCVGIVHTATGYHLMEVSLEERSVEYSERLTPEAVACRLAAYPPADPLIYVPSPTEQQESAISSSMSTSLPFLPRAASTTEWHESNWGGFRIRTKVLPPHLVPSPAPGRSDADRYIQAVVQTLLQLNEKQEDNDEDTMQQGPTVDDFTVSVSSASTNPLYVETASQLGLLKDPTIPSLISYVLDDAAPAATRRFLTRYLLIPPPPTVAQAMSEIVRALMKNENGGVLPPLTVTPLGKVLSLIRAGQASANIYADLLQSLHTTSQVLQNDDQLLPIDSLLTICEHESGLPAEREALFERCEEARSTIEAVISTTYHVDDGSSPDENDSDRITRHGHVPLAFWERNESPWRGRVQPEVARTAYQRVEDAARELGDAVTADFILDNHSTNQTLIVQDIFNNLIALKQIPDQRKIESEDGDNREYIHPKDRHGKQLRNRYTTTRVQQALSDYVTACDQACEEVSSILSALAQSLQDNGHVPAIAQASHLNLILSVAFHHAVKATQLNWHMAETVEPSEGERSSVHFVNVWPYWMPYSQAVSNSFDLDGMFLLTAPNMSGKSTLMRSTAAAALLTICGFCAPLEEGSRIPRFDTLFLRGASADVPTEDKSAFGAEMGDVASLLRCCGSQSLIFVDELGRGTSPRDGTRLAGAVLEAMAQREMKGMFATHLHDISKLPLQGRDRIVNKRMGIEETDLKSYNWTYRLEDGVCTDSLALVTAARFGVPDEVIRRAEELAEYLPDAEASWTPKESRDADDLATMKPVKPRRRLERNLERENNFAKAKSLVEDVTGRTSIVVPPRWTPPPALGNKSCVYVLELPRDPPRFYVGETDSISKRLVQHRRKGMPWSHSRAVVLPVDSKTQARAWENLLIQRMAQSGFTMESITDGRSLRHL